MLFRSNGQPIARQARNLVRRRRAIDTKSHGRRLILSDGSLLHDKRSNGDWSIRYQDARSNRLMVLVCIIALASNLTVNCYHSKLLFCRTASAATLQQSFDTHPNMVRASSLANVTRLEFEPLVHVRRVPQPWIKQSPTNQDDSSSTSGSSSAPDQCEAEEWINDHHPSCLDVHEVDITDFFFNPGREAVEVDGEWRLRKVQFLGQGGFRSAIMFHDTDGTSRQVLKTLKYKQVFEESNLERMRRDAIISEQLTSSPYIADIYGYCGYTSIVDFGSGHTLEYLLEDEESMPTKDEVFQIAADVAQSIADASLVSPNTGRASVIHKDIKPDQWIKVGNRWKLNDFNLAQFLEWNPIKQENCYVASGYSEARYQAPEQFLEDSPRTDKIDVYALGNVLGMLLTNEDPLEDIEDENFDEAVSNGAIWRIKDSRILNSTHPFDVHVRQAMEMCLKFDPKKRPRAQDVATYLREKLLEYESSKTNSSVSEVWGTYSG